MVWRFGINPGSHKNLAEGVLFAKKNMGSTELLGLMDDRGGSFNIFIHNGIVTESLPDALEDMASIQGSLFDFGITLSGFQFVSIVLETSLVNTTTATKVAHFFLSIGFLFSLFGVLVSYIILNYVRSIKQETKEFIVKAMRQHKTFFYLSYVIPYLNSMIFLVPVNLLIHQALDIYYGLIFNSISVVMLIVGLVMHHLVLVKDQRFGSSERRLKTYTRLKKHNL